MKSRVSSTVTKRKPNPRPRKYASASERQAAYRDRAPEVCFRAEPKTVETLDRIADTIDRSRAELLLSMTKFALTNHDWERFGLTHKTLPRYEENPTMSSKIQWKSYTIPGSEDTVYQGAYKGYLATVRKKGGVWSLLLMKDNKTRTPLGIWDSNNGQASGAKAWFEIVVDDESWKNLKANPMKTTRSKRTPTPAQLAARERFAEMARAGSFKKAGGRKKNPDGMGSYGPFYGDTDAPMTEAQIERKAESYMDRLDRQLMRNEITQTVYDREVKALDKWSKSQYAKRRKSNPAPAGGTWLVHLVGKPQSWYATKGSKAAAVRMANMLNKQLGEIRYEVSEAHWSRKTNPARKAAGVRGNPARKAAMAPSTVYQVQNSKDGKAWEVWGTYMYLPMAKDVANRRAAEAPREYVRVESIKVKA